MLHMFMKFIICCDFHYFGPPVRNNRAYRPIKRNNTMKNNLQRICIAFSLVAMLGTLNAQRECSMQEHMQDLLSNPDYALAHQKRQLKFEAVQAQAQNQSKSVLCPGGFRFTLEFICETWTVLEC